MTYQNPPTTPRASATFDEYTLSEIRRAAITGIYDIRGGGAKRKLPNFDDLLFLGASISRYPLEGYRERCGTKPVARVRKVTDIQAKSCSSRNSPAMFMVLSVG